MRMRAVATVALFGLLAPVLAQIPTKAPRIGDVARQLTDQDVEELERTLSAGERPWLFIGEVDQRFVVAFLPPKTTTGELRRGTTLLLNRRSGWKVADWSTRNDARGSGANYAQVAVAGRTFDEIQGDDDMNRPFFVTGQFSDAELVSLVKFIRSRPVRQAIQIAKGPIVSIIGQPSSARICVRERNALGCQFSEMRQQGQSWVLVSISLGGAA
jgi:hypothetical protein